MKPDAQVIAAGLQPLSDHTKAIISFALCGFANLSSVAIPLGGSGRYGTSTAVKTWHRLA